MADLLQQHAISLLNKFREDLVHLDKEKLTYEVLSKCFSENIEGVHKSRVVGGGDLFTPINRRIDAYRTTRDTDVLNELRFSIVEILDGAIGRIDSKSVVRSVLETLILKVKDTKLSTLLKEFNATKDSEPNLAAIAFRTIICLVIQQRAKIKDPSSPLALATDFNYKSTIQKALDENIFDSAEAKLLSNFLIGGLKDMFDNVAHKPGNNALVDKTLLGSAVEILNKLLGRIT